MKSNFLNIDYNKDLVFLDIEADHKNMKLIQFGAIVLRKKEIIKINWFSNPMCKISSRVLKIIGKENLDKIKNAPTNEIILKKIFELLDNNNFISYGDFDYVFLNELFEKFFSKKPNVIFCNIQNEWRKYLLENNDYSLTKLADFFDIKYDIKNLHNAFYDALLLYKIFKKWSSCDELSLLKNIYNIRKNNAKQYFFTKKISDEIIDQGNKKSNGYVLFKSNIKKIYNEKNDRRSKRIVNIKLISIENNKIIENWEYDLADFLKNEDYYKYQLVSIIRKFISSIKNKKILMFQNQINDYKFLLKKVNAIFNIYLNNSCIIINGIEKFINDEKKIDNINYNSELVDLWKALINIKQIVKD